MQKKLPLINSSHGSETRNIINELIKLFNGMGYTYDEALNMAKNVLREAKQTNDKNTDTNSRLNKIIGELTSDAEIIDARGNHPVLKDRLDDVKDNFTLDGWELQNKRREVKPLVTFIDDDGRSDVLTKLKPLSEKYNIPFTVTAYVKAVEEGFNNYMSIEDLQHLQNDLGWEISSHTYNHLNLGSLTYENQEYELKHSKDVLESWGLKVSTICYPYDGRNQDTYELARKYYRSGRRTGGAFNTSPLETYEMRSVPLGSWFDFQGSRPHPTDSLEYYKYQVDQAIEKNGWVIFMTHVADPDHNAIQQSHLEEVIKYIQTKNVDIVTYDEGLNRIGNIVDIGNYGRGNLDRNYYVIGADGTIQGSDTHDLVKRTKYDEYTASTLPSEFRLGYIHETRITVAEALRGNYPVATGGNLKTYTVNTLASELSYAYQEYRPTNGSNKYIRSANSNDTWSEWRKINAISDISNINKFSSASKPSEFPQREITYTQVYGSNSNGFPEDSSGVLVTYDIALNDDRYNYQEFSVFNSNRLYRRQGKIDDSWNEWSNVTSYISKSGMTNLTSTTKASDFTQSSINYNRILSSAATGFPNNSPGILTTNCMFETAGYRWQEYDVYSSWRKFKRYEKSDGSWSEWKEITMMQ